MTKLAHFQLSEPPEGIAIQSVSPDPDGLAILLRADATKAKPGLKGNLIVEAFAEGAVNSSRRLPLGTLPAIPFEIAAKPGTDGTVPNSAGSTRR